MRQQPTRRTERRIANEQMTEQAEEKAKKSRSAAGKKQKAEEAKKIAIRVDHAPVNPIPVSVNGKGLVEVPVGEDTEVRTDVYEALVNAGHAVRKL